MSESQTSTDLAALPGVVSRVRIGSIGIVAAVAAPWREVRVRIHDFAGGVSRVALAEDADAVARAIAEFDADPETTTVVAVLPADATAQIRAAITALPGANGVLCVVDAEPGVVADAEAAGLTIRTRTKPAALAAVIASGADESTLDLHSLNLPLIAQVRATLDDRQRHVRALIREHGVWVETAAIVRERHADVTLAADARQAAPGHAVTLFGQAGETRAEQLVREVADPEVGAVLLDFSLGDGADADPVGALLPAIELALEAAHAEGRVPAILGYVQGTELDPQDLSAQVGALVEAGVIWASSATNAALLAREMVAKD